MPKATPKTATRKIIPKAAPIPKANATSKAAQKAAAKPELNTDAPKDDTTMMPGQTTLSVTMRPTAQLGMPRVYRSTYYEVSRATEDTFQPTEQILVDANEAEHVNIAAHNADVLVESDGGVEDDIEDELRELFGTRETDHEPDNRIIVSAVPEANTVIRVCGVEDNASAIVVHGQAAFSSSLIDNAFRSFDGLSDEMLMGFIELRNASTEQVKCMR
jgi:hypothetical protein